MSYLFGGDNLPQSAEELERLRKVAAALDARRRAPRTIGEGIYALGDGLITGIERNRQNAAERAGRAQANEQFAGLMGGAPDQVRGSAGEAPIAPSLDGPNPSLIRNESGGRWDAQNNVMGAGGMRGHFGRLQFGQARLQEAMQAGAIPPGTTPQQFMASPELQQAAERWHFGDIDNFVSRQGLDRFVGQQINGVPVTREGMRAVAHLGGNNGLARFLQTGGQYNPADANGTRLLDYLSRHGRADRVSGDEGEAMGAPDIAGSFAQGQPPSTQTIGMQRQMAMGLPAPMTEAPMQAPMPMPRPAMPQPQQAVVQAMTQRPMEMMARQPQMSERDRLMLLRDESTLGTGEADQLRAGLGGPVLDALMQPRQAAPQAMPPAASQAPAPQPMPQAAPQATPQGGQSLQQLMAVAQNPWLTDTQRTLVNAMLSQRMRPQEFGFQNVQGLGLVRTDPRTGQVQTVAEVPRAPVALGRDQRLVDANGRQIAGPDNAPQYRPITDPEERRRLGIPEGDTTPYQIDRDGKLSAIGRAQTNVNVNSGGTDKDIYATVQEGFNNARSAQSGLQAIRTARQAVESGGIFGAGADARLQLQKVGAALGLANPESIINTETFRSAIAPQVAAMLKSTVGSANISNADREFAERAAGGSITLDQGTITRLLNIMEKGNIAIVQDHNRRLDAAYPEAGGRFARERELFGLRIPEAPAMRGATPAELQRARDAIARGAPRDGVIRRFQEGGIDPGGL